MSQDATKRVLIGGLFHEGNSFSSLLTLPSDFAVVEGQELLQMAQNSGAGIGGAYRYLVRQSVDVVPFRKATSIPGGAVEDGFYLEFHDALIAAVGAAECDAIYLELHGAMLTQSIDDPEGDLLSAVRKAVGPDPVIAVSLDLHGHVTDRMLRSADIIVACKENPHSDFDRAGEAACDLMLQSLEGRIRPVTCAARVPMIMRAQMETAMGPLAELHALRRKLSAAHPSVLDISIYNTQPLLDVPDGGQCVTVITDDDPDTAYAVATEIAAAIWDRRDAFEPDYPSLPSVLQSLSSGELRRPAVLGDGGDNCAAGTPGDSTAMIVELMDNWPHLRAVVPITDGDVVEAAAGAGAGGSIRACVGGKHSPGVNPVCGTWRVEHLSDGRFTLAGPLLANEPAELGATAVLSRNNMTLLVTSRPGFTLDRAAFTSQGLDPRDFDVVVVKSNHHYKLSFADIGSCTTVDTPGISSYRKGSLPFKRKKPIYPEDDVSAEDFKVNVFKAEARAGSGKL